MFDDIKADFWLILAGVLVAAGLIAGGVIWYQHSEVKTLVNTNAVQNVTIATQAAASSEASAVIANQVVTATNTDQGNIAIASAVTANSSAQAAVAASTTTAITTIQQKYNTQPVTDVTTAAEDKEIATAQITGLWQTFCNTTPSPTASCQAP